MKTLKPEISVLAAMLAAAMVTGCGAGTRIAEYSADQVHMDPEGNAAHTSRLFIAPGKMRMEQKAPDGKGSMIVVYRQDDKKMLTIFPEKEVYVESPLEEGAIRQFKTDFSSDTEAEDLGTETVNGFKCRKKRVKTTTSILGRQMEHESVVWTSDRIDFPLRVKSSEGGVTELRNIKPGKQDDALFEAPEGFRKAGSMFEAMAGGRGKEGNDTGRRMVLPKNLPKGLKLPFGGN